MAGGIHGSAFCIQLYSSTSLFVHVLHLCTGLYNWPWLSLTAGCVVHVEVLILKAADMSALMEDTLDSPDAPARHPPIAVTLIQTEKATHPSAMLSADTAA